METNNQEAEQMPSVDEVVEKFAKMISCIDPTCNDNGVAVCGNPEDPEPCQCQYCYVERFPKIDWLRTTLEARDKAWEQKLEKEIEEERERILSIVNDVDLSYAVNDGRDSKEMYGGQMAACEIRRRILVAS